MGNGCSSLDQAPPPTRRLVVLTVPLHCANCAHKVKRKLHDVEGVEIVTVDAENNRVTVTGTMDTASLVLEIYRRFRKQAQILFQREERGRWRRRWGRCRWSGDDITFGDEDRRRCEEGTCSCCWTSSPEIRPIAYRSALCDDDGPTVRPPCCHGLNGESSCHSCPPRYPFPPGGQLYCYEEPQPGCSIM
ncbi:unnamed protein product [Spirodela intermedia]|uniref:HMA domain-containing protein n=1 Tax=Spirodela intermedia TaxID=51605 RepID=A0A7I8JJE7_SPIIN|nr:unnamed protein product [Spirodela intermedia]CAA6669542.1 unnamed protein product [Spirodela intermedia]